MGNPVKGWWQHARKSNGSAEWASVDAETQAYLERVAGVKGQPALDLWLRYTGWNDLGTLQRPVEARIARARELAMTKEFTT